MTKITITKKQAEQFHRMRNILMRIAKDYQKPVQLQRDSKNDFGLPYEEALEMAYENIQNDAAYAVKGVREIKTKQP